MEGEPVNWHDTNTRVPDEVGPAPSVCFAKVVEVHNADPQFGVPANVNVAVAFSYDLLVQSANGPILFKEAKPAQPRWPYPMLVRAFAKDDKVWGIIMDGAFFMMSIEMPWFGPCTLPTGGA